MVPSTAVMLDRAADQLARAAVTDPRREALVLWAAVAGVSPGRAWLDRATTPPPAAIARYREATRQRAAGVPVAYAAGTAAFRTLDLVVDDRVLIPRPETEGLVERVLELSREKGGGRDGETWGVAADVGTGSGCIALSLAAEGRFERIVATDSSPDALAVARDNERRVRANSVDPGTLPPIEFREGALLAPLAGTRVDVLVANPPYVTAAEWEGLDRGVRDHEPPAALVSGVDGLDHTRVLVRDSGDVVAPRGLLAIEIDCRRADQVLALARAAGWRDARIEPDLFDRPRYLIATRESP